MRRCFPKRARKERIVHYLPGWRADFVKAFSRWKEGSATLEELKNTSVESLRKGIRIDKQMPEPMVLVASANVEIMGRMGGENVPSIALVEPSGITHIPPKAAWAIREAIRLDGHYEMPEVRDALIELAVIANEKSDSPEVSGAKALFMETMKNILLGDNRLSTLCCTSENLDMHSGWEKWLRFAFGKDLHRVVMEDPRYSLADSECITNAIEPLFGDLGEGRIDRAAAERLVSQLAVHISFHGGRNCSDYRDANMVCKQSAWGRNYLRKPSDIGMAEIAVHLGQRVVGRLEAP